MIVVVVVLLAVVSVCVAGWVPLVRAAVADLHPAVAAPAGRSSVGPAVTGAVAAAGAAAGAVVSSAAGAVASAAGAVAQAAHAAGAAADRTVSDHAGAEPVTVAA